MKITLTLSSIILLSIATFSVVSAEENKTNGIRANETIELRIKSNATSTDKSDKKYDKDESEDDDNDSSTTTDKNKRDNNKDGDDNNSTTTDKDNRDNDKNDRKFDTDSHRSAVAEFVKALFKIADRDGGIGEQVREIARAQMDSASTSEEMIAKIENNSKLKIFLFGSDYRNLGKLRKEIVKTQNDLYKLNDLLTETSNSTVKAELQAQIKALEEVKVKVDAFILEQENFFSLFGWFVRPFVK